MEQKQIEWAELWPDGVVRPVHPNHEPVGWPHRPAPYAHRGTQWVRRKVTYGDWETENQLFPLDGGEKPAHWYEVQAWKLLDEVAR